LYAILFLSNIPQFNNPFNIIKVCDCDKN
jgi:hypothetical protein